MSRDGRSDWSALVCGVGAEPSLSRLTLAPHADSPAVDVVAKRESGPGGERRITLDPRSMSAAAVIAAFAATLAFASGEPSPLANAPAGAPNDAASSISRSIG